MLLINQNDYPDIFYPRGAGMLEEAKGENRTIASAGCGLCCCCMMIDRLTTERLELEECRDMAVAAGASYDGTVMEIFGPVVSEKFGLEMKISNNMGELIQWLQDGGCAILNPGGDREGYQPLFTHGGHYILAISYHDGEFLILDPSWSAEKFHTLEREGRVREEGRLVYATPEVITEETENRRPRYYLFRRKRVDEPIDK